MRNQNWFAVDKKGLGKLVERRGKHWVIAELLQNAWDAPGATRTVLSIEQAAQRGFVNVRVEDDSPGGFANLDHAFTLFAESGKKSDPTLRGRFNLGEKLVLALAEDATLHTTTGTITFDREGRTVNRRSKLQAGTIFKARLRMTASELGHAVATAMTYIAPNGNATTINGTPLSPRTVLGKTHAQLWTEAADDDGTLRRVRRSSPITIHPPAPGQCARLYELGIPVMDLPDDTYDVDVGQKVPLTLERDGVSPAYLREVHVAVLACMSAQLDSAAAATPWVADAIASSQCPDVSVRDVIAKRFGERALAYDPSDTEANHRATAQGYTVVAGGTFSAEQWEQIRRAQALPASGHVTPTPRPFTPGGAPAEVAAATPAMNSFRQWLRVIAYELLGRDVEVTFLKDFNAAACYSPGHIRFNVRRLGKRWFEGPVNTRQLSLIIHELAHEHESNHLSEDYYDACTDLGAKLALLALRKPNVVDRQ